MDALVPVRLRADNFTPPSRTPWGGRRLLDRYKAALGVGTGLPDRRVGESWELSVSDEFPSRLEDGGESLAHWIARAPAAALGEEAHAGRAQTALLVKWLDAAEPLSLQIHPQDDYAGLQPGQSGKLEAWYIVEREPGAGLYLGFRPGVRERDVRERLRGDADLSELMAFVTVEPGDFVLLEPGTPHAIGNGLTLIEPQVGPPGKRALTYRYWDWNRRYGPGGVPDPAGVPRELHVEDALAVTRWDRACDPQWLASRRVHRHAGDLRTAARCELLCGPDPGAALRCEPMRVARVSGSGRAALPAWNALRSVTVIEGRAVLTHRGGSLPIPAGSTAAVPAAGGALALELDAATVLVSAAVG